MSAQDLLTTLFDLGRDVDKAWQKAHYDDAALAEIAVPALKAALPSATWAELVEALLEGDLPLQTFGLDNAFGEPPFSVYESDALVVQLLVWTTSTTAIHEHAFTGAFGVLLGSSLHSRYRFAPTRWFSPHAAVGTMAQETIERLTPGEVRPIAPGEGTIHSLFHLDNPSVSIVVRSRTLARRAPQLQYHPPGLALDAHHAPPLALRRRTLLTQACTLDPAAGEAHAARYLQHADAHDAASLMLAVRRLFDRAALHRLVEVGKARHGEAFSMLEAVFAERARVDHLASRRSSVTDAGPRYLLALLFSAPDRATFLRLAGEVADDPVAWTVDTLMALKGTPTGDEEALGLGLALGDAEAYALGALLAGKTEAELIEARPVQMDAADLQRACFVLPHMKALTPLFR